MYILLIFLIIAIIAVYFSRGNFKKRYTMIRENLVNFNNEIKEYYYNLSKENQEEFLSKLNPYWGPNFKSILNNSYNYANNVWKLQKQISQQQELMIELANFAKKRTNKR